MTLPASGPISLAQAAAEYGISGPVTLPNSFYGKPGMPSSGQITLPNDFWGKSNVLSVTISPTTTTRSGNGSPSALITTFNVTASSSNGTGPFTYAWTKVSDNGVGTGWQANSPSAAATMFQATVPSGSTATAVFKVTVTDSTGAQGTANITVTLNNTGP